MKKLLFLILASISLPLFTQVHTTDEFAKNSLIMEHPDNKKVYTYDDNVSLLEQNLQSGIYNNTYNTKDDKRRYSLVFHANSNPTELINLFGFEFIVGSKGKYNWLDFYAQGFNSNFEALASGIQADNLDMLSSQCNLFSGGVGITHRSHIFLSYLNSNVLFETVSAFVGYYFLTESYNGEGFSGPGLKADYGIHKRTSSQSHYGLKFSYNLADVQGEETNYILSFTTLSFDLSFYF